MKNFAGLDLSQLDLNMLTREELHAIEQAFLENYLKIAGTLDLAPANKVVNSLMRFIKINMVAPGAIPDILIPADSLTAIALFFLPTTSAQKNIQNAIHQLQGLPSYSQIQQLQQGPFSLANVALLWDLTKEHKDKFNVTGFVGKSATQLYTAVGSELQQQAYINLQSLGKMRVNLPQDYAWKYLSLQYILHRAHERLQKRDFKYGLDVIDTKRDVKDFISKTYHYMLQTLSDIQALPDHPYETINRSMLPSFNSSLWQNESDPITAEIIAKRSAKVVPW